MTYNFVLFFETNSIFFYLHDYFSNKYYAKSAGTFCSILNFNKNSKLFLIKLPSKKKIFFDFFVIGFLGRASNIFNKYTFLSSFKQKQILKKHKPHVRGVCKNPIDHPNGGSSKVKKPFLTP
jgi:ribosomal protein L2